MTHGLSGGWLFPRGAREEDKRRVFRSLSEQALEPVFRSLIGSWAAGLVGASVTSRLCRGRSAGLLAAHGVGPRGPLPFTHWLGGEEGLLFLGLDSPFTFMSISDWRWGV